MADLPDWTRAVLLQAKTAAGAIVTILVDAAGQLYALLRGEDASGAPQTVQVDSDGQLYVVLRGASGEDVLVDADGFLAALIKGADSGSVLRTVRVDSDGQIVMVPRGQSGNYMNVDANGYLTAVLKGLRDGTLTTIGVNAAGQIECFVLDAESQWGDVLQVGNADLAGRLGSCKTWDWRGNVLFANTFEHGLGNFSKGTSGTGASVTIVPDFSMWGGYSAKLIGGSTSSLRAHIYTKMGRNPTSGYGLEVAWAALSAYDYIEIQILVAVGTVSRYGFIKHTRSTGDLSVWGSDSQWHSFGTHLLENIFNAFNFLKLVIDVDTTKYVRCLLNSTVYDLSDDTLPSGSIGNRDTVSVYVYCYSTSGNNYGFLVDHVILTGNEPT